MARWQVDALKRIANALKVRLEAAEKEVAHLTARLTTRVEEITGLEQQNERLRAALTSKEPHLAAFLRDKEIQIQQLTIRAEDFIAIAEKEQARIEAALALHTEFGIYDECGHDHTEEDVRTGKALDVPEVGLTCEDGLIQKVCRHCHLWNDEPYERTEDGEWPCPTVQALRGGDDAE